MTKESVDRVHLFVLALLVVLGATLRCYRLDTGLWYDEIVTLITSVRLPLAEIVTHFPGNNDHPLYSVLAHITVSVLGEHPWSVRLPATAFGIAAIPMLYLLGREVTNRFESLLATSILTVSYHHIWFSQNARGYTALLFWVLLSSLLLLRWRAEGRKSCLVAYAVVAALGSYTHLTMVFVVVSHALACALELFRQHDQATKSRDWRQAAAAFIGAAVLTALLYAPVFLDVHDFFKTDTASTTEVATPLWALAAALQGLRVGFGMLWMIAIGAAIFCIGVLSYFRQSSTTLYLFLLPAPVTLIAAMALAHPIRPRFFFFLIGFGLLITVRGATVIGTWAADVAGGRINRRRTGMVAAVLMTVAAVAFSSRSLPYGYSFPKQDYDRAVGFVEQNKTREERVAVVGDTAAIPILDYLSRPWQRIDRGDQLDELRRTGKGVWVIYTFPEYIEANEPGFWGALRDECEEVREFEGTIAGGSISVRRCSPAATGPET